MDRSVCVAQVDHFVSLFTACNIDGCSSCIPVYACCTLHTTATANRVSVCFFWLALFEERTCVCFVCEALSHRVLFWAAQRPVANHAYIKKRTKCNIRISQNGLYCLLCVGVSLSVCTSILNVNNKLLFDWLEYI